MGPIAVQVFGRRNLINLIRRSLPRFRAGWEDNYENLPLLLSLPLSLVDFCSGVSVSVRMIDFLCLCLMVVS